MACTRSTYGLLISMLGAVLLIAAVFMPWYDASLTSWGASHVASAAPASLLGLRLGARLAVGQALGGLSASTALGDLSVILVALAFLALLDATLALLRSTSSEASGAGQAVVPLGTLACVCVCSRMAFPPTLAGGALSLSLREGAWLALLGGLMVAVGGMWPQGLVAMPSTEGARAEIWSSLTGSAPGA